MPILDNVIGFSVCSEFFSVNKDFNLFPNSNNKKTRIALVYGRNGSGKSTIARGFYEYANNINPRTVDVKLLAGTGHLHIGTEEKPDKIFVFDEDYVDKNVRIKEDGLGTIVLLGEQVDVEDEINSTTESLNEKKKTLEIETNSAQTYSDPKSTNSPNYWLDKITKHLRKGWADISGKQIKGNLKSSTVNESVIHRIAQIKTSRTHSELETDFKEKYELLKSTTSNTQTIDKEARQLTYETNIEIITKRILQEIVSKPTLTDREQKLLDLFGINDLLSSKNYIQTHLDSVCPTCLQVISKEHSNTIISEIDNIVSREFEEFKERLGKLMLNTIDADSFSVFEPLDASLYTQLLISINKLNESIEEHNAFIEKKLNSPFEIIDYTVVSLCNNFISANKIIKQIEQKRSDYNAAVSNRSLLIRGLLNINDEIAAIDIKDDYKAYKKCVKNKEDKDREISTIKEEIRVLNQKLNELNGKRENLTLAEDALNEGLKYIFFSEKRLQLKNDDKTKTYKLRVNEQEVAPNKVSSGERNALALCYFFSDIAKHMEAQTPYSEEMLLVIDDPISSFDFENRIGILSFLKYKFKEVMLGCDSTKVILLSHDISTVIDLTKVFEDISIHCKNNSKPAYYSVYKLYNKELSNLGVKKYNEYTELLKSIFDFSDSDSTNDDITIGNQIRRVLEAFSTFSYKKGISQLLSDEKVLSNLPTEKLQNHFENLMFRLVLHGESHYEDTARFFPQSDFYAHLTPEEKHRTAKDVLCLMYLLNPNHILSHMPEAKDKLEQWKSEIL